MGNRLRCGWMVGRRSERQTARITIARPIATGACLVGFACLFVSSLQMLAAQQSHTSSEPNKAHQSSTTSAVLGNQPMSMASRKQLLQVALALADRTL
jgi:hypothetical protein